MEQHGDLATLQPLGMHLVKAPIGKPQIQRSGIGAAWENRLLQPGLDLGILASGRQSVQH